MKITKESKYAHSLDRCEVESVVNPLKDKEPTPAWYEKLTQVLKHYDISFRQLSLLAETSKRSNLVGNPYTVLTLKNTINNFKWHKGAQTWTKNAQYTVNDHLDILIDYLSKPEKEAMYDNIETVHMNVEEHPNTMVPLPGETWEQYVERVHPGTTLSKAQKQEAPVLTLKERLEKERAEGKWPSVDEKMAFGKLVARATASLKPMEDSIPEYDGLGKSDCVKVKPRKIRKKHKKHHARKIVIYI